ncbi:MAG TPA: nucleoside kinase [bacterium]|nr:nucleoside kinase [bacterium]
MAEKIVITVGKKKLPFSGPVSIWQIAAKLGKKQAREAVAALVSNRLVDMNYVVPCDADVEMVMPDSYQSFEIYRRTAMFILVKAIRDLKLNAEIIIGQSVESGVYYDFRADRPLVWGTLQKINERMQEIIDENLPLVRAKVNYKELMEYFQSIDREGKAKVAAALNRPFIDVYKLGSFQDIAHHPLAPSTGVIRKFELIMYPPGFVLRFPDFPRLDRMPAMKHQTKLFENYLETKDWYRIVGVKCVGDLNDKASNKRSISDLIKISESLHEKKIARIADTVAQRRDKIKMILIAGPSSSGKTTFAKRLSIQLMVNGITPVALSLDDYFVPRHLTPRDEDGEYDFEAIEALDLALINSHFRDLLAGKEVGIPAFDFKDGKRTPDHKRLKLLPGQVLIIEGIHGLNDRLTAEVPADNKYKIFVSALTQLRIDGMTRISTSDTRLIRRMVRDFRYRSYSASDTIKRWPSVRRGEDRNIFPFQNNADELFNSALVYELSALKSQALSCLESVTPSQREYLTARRLIEFLRLFRSVYTDEVPPTSIIREFIGGSSFSYK